MGITNPRSRVDQQTKLKNPIIQYFKK